MKNFNFLVSLLFIAILLFACKEEPLTPNEAAALNQQLAIYNINHGGSGGSGGGNGGGSGGSGGGAPVDIYFSAEVDGVLKTESNPYYQDGLGIKQVLSTSNSVVGLFSININGDLEVKTVDNPFISYYKSITSIYDAYNGKLILDSVTTDLVQGTFYFDAANSANNDTISVTNGRFRVERL